MNINIRRQAFTIGHTESTSGPGAVVGLQVLEWAREGRKKAFIIAMHRSASQTSEWRKIETRPGQLQHPLALPDHISQTQSAQHGRETPTNVDISSTKVSRLSTISQASSLINHYTRLVSRRWPRRDKCVGVRKLPDDAQ